MKLFIISAIFMILTKSCQKDFEVKDYDSYPFAENTDLWPNYDKDATILKIWAPTAQEVIIRLFNKGNESGPFTTHQMNLASNGVWTKKIEGDLEGTYYTFQVKVQNNWLDETPGMYAQAVGVNGDRAMVLNLETTNP
ncbi:hypothetical protein NYZ99_14355 [Maribacter litopenaei]|uniref:Glycoside hydrolase family 13 N-terminal domain-containing protein n=1 Tax=Maribacter litopenaei TaxID=2976127 RepID=A0ABY5Y563_9FLAO|nr:hypothetical protein [Maribacter litopenaei]UWX54172.1 hypothetical protein NYZ99_14355 [Maribacter litopenaei]